MDALKKEITSLQKQTTIPELNTVFIGGGTPTCIPAGLMSDLLRHVKHVFDLMDSVEFSIEANPGTVDRAYLTMLLESGVNRISFGVQTFDDTELRALGRTHNSKIASAAVREARACGFQNINLDLMYGLPGQGPASWSRSVEKGLSLPVTHLSLYQLTVEPGTVLEELLQKKTISLPPEDDVLKMDEITEKMLTTEGFYRYEISNYAKDGFECHHNINYWMNLEYMAAGAAAVSFQEGWREKRVVEPSAYIGRIASGESVIGERECLSHESSLRESVIMGLRMTRGVSCETVFRRYGLTLENYYGNTLSRLIDEKLIELTATHLRITEKGFPFSNMIMAELV